MNEWSRVRLYVTTKEYECLKIHNVCDYFVQGGMFEVRVFNCVKNDGYNDGGVHICVLGIVMGGGVV